MEIETFNETRLTDSALAEIQQSLKKNLKWLEKSFGKAQRITKEIKGKTFIFPACFSGGKEYVGVEPCSNHGNFSFFVLRDPQEFDGEIWGKLTVKVDLIVWLDVRRIYYLEAEERNIELVKDEILKVLTQKTRLSNGKFTVNRIFERAENIYGDFPAIREANNQFLMHPFAAFRFECTLKIEQVC